jgi:hypothetical protein
MFNHKKDIFSYLSSAKNDDDRRKRESFVLEFTKMLLGQREDAYHDFGESLTHLANRVVHLEDGMKRAFESLSIFEELRGHAYPRDGVKVDVSEAFEEVNNDFASHMVD